MLNYFFIFHLDISINFSVILKGFCITNEYIVCIHNKNDICNVILLDLHFRTRLRIFNGIKNTTKILSFFLLFDYLSKYEFQFFSKGFRIANVYIVSFSKEKV